MIPLAAAAPWILRAIGVAGLGASAGANLYGQNAQRALYGQLGRGYYNLHQGYARYLARQGRHINPNRAITSYYGQYLRSKTNQDVSMANSVGTLAGTLGAGSMITSRWL